MYSLKRKYGNEIYVEFKNKQGFNCCDFGTLRDGPLGCVELIRDKGKDGKERIYVNLIYYPFDMNAVEDEL